MKNIDCISSSSVILASGGGKGITARCVRKMAEVYQSKFILLGRSSIENPLPAWASIRQDDAFIKKNILEEYKTKGLKVSPMQVQKTANAVKSQLAIHDTLQAIRRAGGEAEYYQADITETKSLETVLDEARQRFGPITGILHGAGNLADRLIENKSEQDYDSVVSPKVDGLENMLKCIQAEQLEFLILFSSVAGYYGNKGQSDYAIANEILNKSAHFIKKRYPSCRVISIDWGPWEIGMVSPDLQKTFEANHIRMIPAQAGAGILLQEINSNDSHVQVIVGDPLPQSVGIKQDELRTHTIHRKLTLEANPFLSDHVIGNNPVLPATCAATWVVNICEQLYPGLSFFKLENYRVLKGIVFDNSKADDYTLELQETAKTDDGRILFEALIWSRDDHSKQRYHYRINVELRRQLPAMPRQALPSTGTASSSKNIQGNLLYQNGILFHGPSFQGIDRVTSISPHHLSGICNLPELTLKQQGQFPVQTGNPYIYDAILQHLLVWTQYYHGTPCLPSYLKSLEQFKPVPFNMPCTVHLEIETQNDHSVSGNATVLDQDGRIYLKITGMQATISKNLNRLIGSQIKHNIPDFYESESEASVMI